MKKPLIGLTPSHDLSNDDLIMHSTYMKAISNAGGIPMILPLEAHIQDFIEITETLDGFLLTGGPDPNPFIFGEQIHINCGTISALRDKMELSLIKCVMDRRKPILGICRGIQTINIALGGTLYQDLPSQFKEEFPIAHKQHSHYTNYAHKVTICENSLLHNILGQHEILVNSMHHQAIRDLASGLTVDGFASNQLIEAVHMEDYPYLLAVQWHPEYLWPFDKGAAKLFCSFVDSCQ